MEAAVRCGEPSAASASMAVQDLLHKALMHALINVKPVILSYSDSSHDVNA